MLYYDKKVVGERIKEARRRRKMTQSSLAEKLDYTTERQLQRIENGETSCSVDKLMEIAQILEVSTDYLLTGDIIDKDKLLLSEKLDKLTSEEIRLVEGIIDECIGLYHQDV